MSHMLVSWLNRKGLLVLDGRPVSSRYAQPQETRLAQNHCLHGTLISKSTLQDHHVSLLHYLHLILPQPQSINTPCIHRHCYTSPKPRPSWPTTTPNPPLNNPTTRNPTSNSTPPPTPPPPSPDTARPPKPNTAPPATAKPRPHTPGVVTGAAGVLGWAAHRAEGWASRAGCERGG